MSSYHGTLGLSVDGGVDTNQKEIRVTTVKPGGAAYHHGFLKVISPHNYKYIDIPCYHGNRQDTRSLRWMEK